MSNTDDRSAPHPPLIPLQKGLPSMAPRALCPEPKPCCLTEQLGRATSAGGHSGCVVAEDRTPSFRVVFVVSQLQSFVCSVEYRDHIGSGFMHLVMGCRQLWLPSIDDWLQQGMDSSGGQPLCGFQHHEVPRESSRSRGLFPEERDPDVQLGVVVFRRSCLAGTAGLMHSSAPSSSLPIPDGGPADPSPGQFQLP